MAAARGSAKVAVPTWTARRAGEDQLGGVPAVATPPTPMIGRSGHGGVHVVHGADGDRVDRRSGQPAAAGAQRRGGGARS